MRIAKKGGREETIDQDQTGTEPAFFDLPVSVLDQLHPHHLISSFVASPTKTHTHKEGFADYMPEIDHGSHIVSPRGMVG